MVNLALTIGKLQHSTIISEYTSAQLPYSRVHQICSYYYHINQLMHSNYGILHVRIQLSPQKSVLTHL